MFGKKQRSVIKVIILPLKIEEIAGVCPKLKSKILISNKNV